MNHLLRFSVVWLLATLTILVANAQDEGVVVRELILTPEPLPRYATEGNLGGYRIKGTTEFVDELVSRHLNGDLTLYRDYRMEIPYLSMGPLLGYLDTANLGKPVWFAESGTESVGYRTRGMDAAPAEATGPEVVGDCEGCLSVQSWQWMMFGREAVSVEYENREDLLSKIKQMWKLRTPLEVMAPLKPWLWNQDRFLFLTAAVLEDEKGEDVRMDIQRGVIMVEFPLQRRGLAETDMAILVFDPEDEQIPWEKLEVQIGMNGIQEAAADAKKLLLEGQTNMAPLGYREGVDAPFQGFYGDLKVDTLWERGQFLVDSVLSAWNASEVVNEYAVPTLEHPMQSKSYSIYLDAGWFSRPITASDWTKGEHREKDWRNTQEWVQEASDSILTYWEKGELDGYAYHSIRSDVPTLMTALDAQVRVKRLLKRVVAHAHAVDFQVAEPNRTEAEWDSLANLTRFDYSWKVDGKLIWYNGDVVFRPQWITLVWQDPKGIVPGFAIGSIEVMDLSLMGLTIGKEPIEDLLAGLDFAYYPLSVNGQRFQSLDQATMVKLIMEKGAWDAIPTWLEMGYFPYGGGDDAFWESAYDRVRTAMKESEY